MFNSEKTQLVSQYIKINRCLGLVKCKKIYKSTKRMCRSSFAARYGVGAVM